MTSVHKITTDRNPAPHHRRAYGAHRRADLSTEARWVAESMLLHQAEGRTRSLADYGIVAQSPKGAMVREWLRRLAA